MVPTFFAKEIENEGGGGRRKNIVGGRGGIASIAHCK
jgi:hypothetical protein